MRRTHYKNSCAPPQSSTLCPPLGDPSTIGRFVPPQQVNLLSPYPHLSSRGGSWRAWALCAPPEAEVWGERSQDGRPSDQTLKKVRSAGNFSENFWFKSAKSDALLVAFSNLLPLLPNFSQLLPDLGGVARGAPHPEASPCVLDQLPRARQALGSSGGGGRPE